MLINNIDFFLNEETDLRKEENYAFTNKLISRKNFFSV